ncbi:class I poly(R)-hydroxyalkanoic acid synthase [Cypionkella aquatica]|uniref:Class I poly(R)-hydroxyalkanoic acid synthase n=1 Tax=Cypionkella aquatica TaxID=1756042 RepID=A0AA37TSF8_9RHOB|nr:class I poly(R)-hydroxyalkanoic acid synthase [Cypionkella aquatica]GLS86924.1 class I poly(R)-hydroxyalkanoic acid synthase [Cypionkella aquatica]
MTTEDNAAGAKLEKMTANLAKIEALSTRLMAALANKRATDPGVQAPGQEIYMKAAAAYLAAMMQNPGKVLEQQIAYWGRTMKHYVEAQTALASGELRAPADTGPKDRRFANPLWDTHPAFNYIKQQYLFNAEAVQDAIGVMDSIDPGDKKRVEYFTKQIVDMLSPTNFLGTNPDALEKAVATDGESLVRGLENLVADIEANNGELAVTLADREAFVLGENIATTPGSVVFRNRMLELIQYAPTTATVYQTPLLIFPPWINKFYVMDLKPQNSLIKWIVDQGFTLFVVSWVNPDASYADIGMDDYIREGYLTAMAEVRRITGEAQINAVGYCIAGTTLSLTLSHLHRAGDTSVKSATFFTMLTDFSDPGEVGVFLDNDFLDGIERQSNADGILSKTFMSRTFSYLRSNDLIYGPAIKSYMLGEAPPAFDLLYWNGDGTNLPCKMAMEYLRGLCQDNGLANGAYKVFGHNVSLKDVQIPVCAIACETDHIAHWRGSFNGFQQMGAADKTFIVSQSGHIAGIINPPSKGKYGHYTNAGPVAGDPDAWMASATFNQGSWWPRWGAWLAAQSGDQIDARVPGDSGHPVLCAAPGSYVTAQPNSPKG